jgi:putative intracellular protease/amidase
MLAGGGACYDNRDMGHTVLLLVGDDYEDLELHYPRLRLREAGHEPVVAGAAAGAEYRGKHGYPGVSDQAIAGLEAAAAGSASRRASCAVATTRDRPASRTI